MDDRRLGTPAVYFNGHGWTVFRRYLGTGQSEVTEAELWAIRVALRHSVGIAQARQSNGVKKVAILTHLQAAIQWIAHLDPGPV